MHFTTSIFAGLTAFGFVSAAVDFPYTYWPSCVATCNEEAGKVCYADYTEDPNSPNFMESLSCLCDSTNPGHTTFINSLNTCMDEGCWLFQRLPFEYSTEGKMCAWYNKNKVTPKPTESKSTASNAEVTTELHKSTKVNIESHKSTEITTESHKPTKASSTPKSIEATPDSHKPTEAATTKDATESYKSTDASTDSQNPSKATTESHKATEASTSKATAKVHGLYYKSHY
ncbi:hypothetical protein K7432_011326 [Basidiobolus ranarum]|uniref:Uncharacterized protein n=1 Tax=Basidiobolus ranarum TaxID=34480 RepID=A0ABR2WMI5_9FUNG